MVKTELLKVGRVYKYKELCELFGEHTKTSDSKIAQLREWKRYFDWENPTTQKYIVTEIFDTIKEKEDWRKNNGGNNTSKYKELDLYILNYLLTKRHLEGTLRKMLIDINILTNECTTFNPAHKKRIDAKKEIRCEFSDVVVNNVLWRMTIVSNAMKNALFRLRKQGYVRCEMHIIIVLKDGSGIVELNESETEYVYKLQVNVKKRLHLTEKQLYNEEMKDIYTHEVIKEVEREYRDSMELKLGIKLDESFIDYYYTSYKVYMLNDEYEYNNSVDVRRMTSLFVKQIGYAILSSYAKKRYYLDDKIILDIKNYMQQLFTHLDYDMWMDYWNIQLTENLQSKDDIFKLGFIMPCTVNDGMHIKKTINENSDSKIDDDIKEREKNVRK